MIKANESILTPKLLAELLPSYESPLTLEQQREDLKGLRLQLRSAGNSYTAVTILGNNLTGATSVTFNGTAATSFTLVSSTEITTTVPSGATTGYVKVTTPHGTLTSNMKFQVRP